jgi:hypothetical protein
MCFQLLNATSLVGKAVGNVVQPWIEIDYSHETGKFNLSEIWA